MGQYRLSEKGRPRRQQAPDPKTEIQRERKGRAALLRSRGEKIRGRKTEARW